MTTGHGSLGLCSSNPDGLEATRRIRGMDGGGTTPIYGLSAGAFAANERAALDAGMDGYLIKPVEVDDLRDLLKRVRVGGDGES